VLAVAYSKWQGFARKKLPGVSAVLSQDVRPLVYGNCMAGSVVDLFSGGGGASTGFHAHPDFQIVGAADAQLGKPSSGNGTLDCNATYLLNIGTEPVEADLGIIDPSALAEKLGIKESPTVLIACPPCTGFSRTLAKNHLEDDHRNSLVGKTADFVAEFEPQILIMENARELVMGRFKVHLASLVEDLQHRLGYEVKPEIHFLNRFGLPQKRERAVLIAVKRGLPLRTLDDLWEGYTVDPKATHVRRAIWELPALKAGGASTADTMHVAPAIRDKVVFERLNAIPADGGSWFDLARHPEASQLLTPTMRDRLARNDLGSHPDVYGRMWWDRPAPTIKRECSHVGNGRYSHPEQDRLCSVRELAILNGFPANYTFAGSINNMYRHIGDAVPPLISFQLAALASWILGGAQPNPDNFIMPNTHLRPSDVIRI
jgi:DNA (cytosine-5)-methyltransferase 1